jgi:hypothetical protein
MKKGGKIQGTRFKAQGTRIKAQGMYWISGLRDFKGRVRYRIFQPLLVEIFSTSLIIIFSTNFWLFGYSLPNRGTVVTGEMDRFFGAVGTDLPWEHPQIIHRLGTDYYEETIK